MATHNISIVHDWALLAMSDDGPTNPEEVDFYILKSYELFPYRQFWGKVDW